MSQSSKRDYLHRVHGRYQRAGRTHKRKILDEFCAVCGYHRKHALRLLNRPLSMQRKRPGPEPEYGPELLPYLKRIWLATDQLCSKRLAPALKLWVPFDPEIPPEHREKLLKISPAQIDRLLRPIRAHYPASRRRTRPGSLIAQQIPIRTDNDDITEPGYLEVDTVAHGGETTEGDFAWSSVYTDFATTWTEARATWNRTAAGVQANVAELEPTLPFPLAGFDSDNGSEFINYGLFAYLRQRDRPVHFTRSRAYKKNDNAHVEQKNWTHVRELLGYERLDNPEVVPLMNDLYRNEWRQFQNFFCPSFKLESKKRVGGKIIKKYGAPQTPYERVMASESISPENKQRLRAEYNRLNPFELKRAIEKKLKRIFTVNRQAQKVVPAARENDEFCASDSTVEEQATRAGATRTSPVEIPQRVGSSSAQVALPQSPILRTSAQRVQQRGAINNVKAKSNL